jgi:hypothetical protein
MYDGLLYILFIKEIKDIILNSMESPRSKDPLCRRTCKIEKTRTDQAVSKLTEQNWNFFFLSKIRRGNYLVSSASMVHCSYGPEYYTLCILSEI